MGVVCDHGAVVCDPKADASGSRFEALPMKTSRDSSNGCSDGKRLKGQLLLNNPRFLVTNRPVTDPIAFAWAHSPTGDGAEKTIKDTMARLVSLTDVKTGAAVPVEFVYTEFIDDYLAESVQMKPNPLLSSNAAYRITLKANTESDDPVVYSIADSKPLTSGEESVVFYTASRPMITEILALGGSWETWVGVGIYFSELVASADLAGRVTAEVDGVPLAGCVDMRGSCGAGCESLAECEATIEISGATVEAARSVRFMRSQLPATFGALTIRLPGIARGARGSFSEGAQNNRYATVEGDDVVYTIPGTEFINDSHEGFTMIYWSWKP
jgi:hypothetical protein